MEKPKITFALYKMLCKVNTIIGAWSLKVNTINKAEEFKMWRYRRLLIHNLSIMQEIEINLGTI